MIVVFGLLAESAMDSYKFWYLDENKWKIDVQNVASNQNRKGKKDLC